jgi:hypothetical protein
MHLTCKELHRIDTKQGMFRIFPHTQRLNNILILLIFYFHVIERLRFYTDTEVWHRHCKINSQEVKITGGIKMKIQKIVKSVVVVAMLTAFAAVASAAMTRGTMTKPCPTPTPIMKPMM